MHLRLLCMHDREMKGEKTSGSVWCSEQHISLTCCSPATTLIFGHFCFFHTQVCLFFRLVTEL